MIEHPRNLPAQPERVETGPVAFGEDWPGVFVRGDEATYYAEVLAQSIEAIRAGREPSKMDLVVLSGLADLLASCRV
jgi:hypothetical protein